MLHTLKVFSFEMCNLCSYLVLAVILDHMFIHLSQLYEDKEDIEKERKSQSFWVCDKLLHFCLISALTSLRHKRAMTGIDKSTKKKCQRREGIRRQRKEKEVKEKVKALAGLRRA